MQKVHPSLNLLFLSLAATDLVGWIGKFRYSYAAWSGNDIKFRPVSFYCAVAEQLADEGF